MDSAYKNWYLGHWQRHFAHHQGTSVYVSLLEMQVILSIYLSPCSFCLRAWQHQSLAAYTLSNIEEGKKKNFAGLEFYFCLMIVGEFQMRPIEATGLFNSTFAGNIKELKM